jgi:GR25 family glycosyltransferase involved in LPS biosynthesis
MIDLKDICYSIISINDRAIDNTTNTRNMLNEFKEIFFDCVDGNTQDAKKILKNYDISISGWNWHSPPIKGELGIWLSNINLFKKMLDNNIKNVLLFEDDAIISNNFNNTLASVLKDLPNDYDFLSLVFPSSSKYLYKEDADIGLKTICSSKYNHFGTYAILWSNSGAKKMLNLLSDIGITCPIDIHLYSIMDGYSIKPDQEQVVFHGYDKYGSIIDLNRTRGMLDV